MSPNDLDGVSGDGPPRFGGYTPRRIMKRILVTGATGQIGGKVVAQLRNAGCRVRALSRSPQNSKLPHDVEIAQGDLSAPATLDAALDGVDAIFLVWVGTLEAATSAIPRIAPRTDRIVLLSSPHRAPHPFFQQPNGLRAIHAGLDRLVEESGRQWTILRPGPFALNCRNWWASQIATSDVVRWCHAEAETAPVDERDIAAVAVRALLDDGHDGHEYVLTGPASLTQREQVRIIGEGIGRPLAYDDLAPAEAREVMQALMPVPVVSMLFDAYGAAVGTPAFLTSTIADITGTPAHSFRQWATDHAADFARAVGIGSVRAGPIPSSNRLD